MSSIRRASSRIIHRLSRLSVRAVSRLSRRKKRVISDSVPIVRQKFLDLSEQSPDLFDDVDIQKVKDDDYLVQRFCQYRNNDVDASFKQLDQAMRWRKSFGVNSLPVENCPKELFELGAMFRYGSDKIGNRMIYFRVKKYRKIPAIQNLTEKFIVAIINQMDQETNGHFVIVADMTDAGISNFDLNLIKFLIEVVLNYFPSGCKYVIVYNLPWILKGLWKVVAVGLGEQKKLLKVAKGQEIKEWVDEDQLPCFLGGTCKESIIDAPKECPSIYETGHLYGLNKQEIDKVLKENQDLFDEAKKETEKIMENLK